MEQGRNSIHVLAEDAGEPRDRIPLDDDSPCIHIREDIASPSRLVIAQAWIQAGQVRERVFEPGLFGDPAWDILLDLYVNFVRKRLVSISDLYIACSAPPTTILRWIGILETRQLVERQSDPTDRRRRHVSLTALGVQKMEQALDGATESDRRLGIGRLAVVGPIGRN